SCHSSLLLRHLLSFPTRRSSDLIDTRRAPASIAFSTSSLTTDAGRSTTSPAAIWFARSAGRRVIFPIKAPGSHPAVPAKDRKHQDRKSTRLNSSHLGISYAVFCL